MSTYYAVCNVNGPISVRLDAESKADAMRKFEEMDPMPALDGCKTEMEDDLNIEGESMTESEFADAVETAGAMSIMECDGWTLWVVA